MKALCALLPWIVLVATAAVAGDDTDASRRTMRIYSAAQAHDADPQAAQRFDRLRSGDIAQPGDFTGGRARISFKNEKRATVQVRELSIATTAPAAGWQSRGAFFAWKGEPGTRPSSLSMTLAPAAANTPFRLADYDQLWVDYTVAPGIEACSPHLDLAVRSHGQARLRIRTPGAPASRVISTIEAQHAAWSTKGLGYVVAREIGLAPADGWYYAQDAHRAVLQQPMHRTLDGVEAIEIEVEPGFRVEHVNLRIVGSDTNRSGEVMSFPELLRSPPLPDGRSGVRIELRSALDARSPSRASHLYLNEITIFAPGNASFVGAGWRPVRSVAFLGAPDVPESTARAVSTLPTQLATLDSTRFRLVADLRRLAPLGEMDLETARLEVAAPRANAQCVIRIERVAAAAPFSETLPWFVAQAEAVARRWSGTSWPGDPQPSVARISRMVGHMFFAAMTASDLRQAETLDYQLHLGANRDAKLAPLENATWALPYRIVAPDRREVIPDDAVFVASNGATLRAEGAPPRVSAAVESLLIEGRSRALEIAWPIRAAIGRDTSFYLGMPEGAEQIADIIATIEVAGGGSVQRRVVPNRAQRLGVPVGEIRGLRLRLMPVTAPFRVKLMEVALFESASVPYAEAFATPVPIPFTEVPKVSFGGAVPVGIIDVSDGRVVGLAAAFEDEALRFSTRMEPRVRELRGLRLRYRLPATIGGVNDCPLSLRFNWTAAKADRHMCFNRSAGDLFIPFANLDVEPGKDLGELESIDWALRPAPAMDRSAVATFELGFGVEGWAPVTPAEQVAMAPVFLSEGRPVLAKRSAAMELMRTAYQPTAWLPLEPDAVRRVMTMHGPIQPIDNPFFTLEQVVLDARAPLGEAQWQSLERTFVPPATGKWPRWIALVILIAAVAAAWRYARPAMAALAAKVGPAWHAVPGWLTHRIRPTLTWRAFNAAMIFATFVPGLWLAGRVGWNYRGTMLLFALALFALAAYAHWKDEVPPWRHAALFLGGAFAAWSLGQFGIGPETAWGFLPIVAALYAFLAAARDLLRYATDAWRHVARALAWLAVCVAVYAAAFGMLPFGAGSISTILAAIAGVMSMRNVVLAAAAFLSERSAAARRIRAMAGGAHFVAACVLLAAAAIALFLKREVAANQAAMMVYIAVLIGGAREVRKRIQLRHGAAPH